MTESLIDLRALLVEREDFEGGMVGRLREGLAQGGPQVRALKDIIDTLTKRLAVAAPPQQKKIHLKLGVANYFLGHVRVAVDNLLKAEGPLAAFFLGQAHVTLGQSRQYAEDGADTTDHYDAAVKAFERAEKSGYAPQSVQLQRAGVLRLQGHLGESKTILAKLKDAAAHNAEYYYQEGALAEAEGDIPRAAKYFERAVELEPRHSAALFRLGFLNDQQGNDYEAIGYYERCLKYPPVGKGVLYNLGVLYEDNDMYDKAADCYRRLAKADPRDERAKLFVKDSEASLSMHYDPEDEQLSQANRVVLEIPITDFELSVRSRNCLKRMNIRTLGDLTRVTESQLLASKNFGETSLEEIKIIMNAKQLRIGQSLDQGQQYEFRYRPQQNLSPEEQATLNKPVSDLNLSVRARKCMNRLNIGTLGELVQRTADELLEAKNFGQTSLTEVRERLGQFNLKLRGD
ncbi:DNA-directed RNA polymerase subunit alpha C-terminal domain-containing protein [Gemmata massiliana]|uniref:DNA-directed RNA polymerase subunit alpha C-terminal domain-containing protein n=1 Tax=Gemmata massiliana TaxID=1210884 RepID=UPI0013A6F7F1|nr:DNA-directed RNA polymerase subunit alpha C-terminal domain-containing protein [Gemmata massiliana]